VLAQACQAAGIKVPKRGSTNAVVGATSVPVSVPRETPVLAESGHEGDNEGAHSPVYDTAGPAAAAEEAVCATSSDSDPDSIFEFHGRRRRRGLLAASISRQRTPALVRRKPQPVAALPVKQDTLDHLLQFLGLCVVLSVLLSDSLFLYRPSARFPRNCGSGLSSRPSTACGPEARCPFCRPSGGDVDRSG
jgi:hypothetical protein